MLTFIDNFKNANENIKKIHLKILDWQRSNNSLIATTGKGEKEAPSSPLGEGNFE